MVYWILSSSSRVIPLIGRISHYRQINYWGEEKCSWKKLHIKLLRSSPEELFIFLTISETIILGTVSFPPKATVDNYVSFCENFDGHDNFSPTRLVCLALPQTNSKVLILSLICIAWLTQLFLDIATIVNFAPMVTITISNVQIIYKRQFLDQLNWDSLF